MKSSPRDKTGEWTILMHASESSVTHPPIHRAKQFCFVSSFQASKSPALFQLGSRFLVGKSVVQVLAKSAYCSYIG